MAAEPLGQRMHHDVSAMLQRFGEIRSAERAIDDQRQTVVVRDFGDGLQISDFERGIRDGFTEDRTRLVINGSAEVFRIIAVHKLHLNAQCRQDVVELRVGAAVEIAG